MLRHSAEAFVLFVKFASSPTISRQLGYLYARGNSLVRNFGRCSADVKSLLFKAYITNIYCSQLWCSYKPKAYNDCKVAYDNVFRRFFNVPRHIDGVTVSVSESQDYYNVPTFDDIVDGLRRSLFRRLSLSSNGIIIRIVNSDMYKLSYLASLVSS